MGYYIPGPTIGKALYLVRTYGAEFVRGTLYSFDEAPSDKALVCVVLNGMFDAAAYCSNEKEFKEFSNPEDRRLKTWLLMDKKLAEELSGFNK